MKEIYVAFSEEVKHPCGEFYLLPSGHNWGLCSLASYPGGSVLECACGVWWRNGRRFNTLWEPEGRIGRWFRLKFSKSSA